jgi:hypothetical protein
MQGDQALMRFRAIQVLHSIDGMVETLFYVPYDLAVWNQFANFNPQRFLIDKKQFGRKKLTFLQLFRT